MRADYDHTPRTSYRPPEIVESAAYRAAEAKLAFWAVVLCGPRDRIPRRFGDNEGAWPVRVGISRDPQSYAERVDIDAGGIHEYVALEWTWTLSQRHASRIKAALDVMLLGDGERNRLRHGWRDISDPEIEWPILLGQALSEMRESIETFGDEEKVRRVLAEMWRERTKAR